MAIGRFGSSSQELKHTCRLITYLAVMIAWPPVVAADSTPARLKIEPSLYPYVSKLDNDVDLSATINATLGRRLSYFSFINYRGVLDDGGVRMDRTEQTLRWSLNDELPIDLSLQGVIVDGDGNDDWQLGISWRADDTGFLKPILGRMHLSYRLTFHLYQISSPDDRFWQMEHYFKMLFPGITDRLYLSGFLDQTFGLRDSPALPDHPVVTEIQLGLRLVDNFYAVSEYRINEYRPAAVHNLAAGIEYKFSW